MKKKNAFINFVLTGNPLVISLLSLLMSLVLSGIIMALAGFSPFEAYAAMAYGAFGDISKIADTLGIATPLIFTGLAVTVALKGGVLNVGAEGQLYMGAMAAALTGVYVKGLPSFLHIPLCFLAAMAAGGLWAALGGLIKIKARVSEVIVTIMLNYIALYITDYLVTYVFKSEGLSVKTENIAQTAVLPQIVPKTRLTIGLIFALVAVLFIWWMFKRTKLGYEMRALGSNPFAAETGGINSSRMIIITMLISGALAGLAGAVEVQGVHLYFIKRFSPGYGWDGLATSVLGQTNPFGMALSAFFYGALRNGAIMMDRTTKMPGDFVVIMQALIIMFVASPAIARTIFAFKKGEKNK